MQYSIVSKSSIMFIISHNIRLILSYCKPNFKSKYYNLLNLYTQNKKMRCLIRNPTDLHVDLLAESYKFPIVYFYYYD